MSEKRSVVLVVDDDAAVRDSLRFFLEQEGLELRLYPDGDALLKERNLPSEGCLVIDFYMLGMNGVDLVARLRNKGVELPAILITGAATPKMRTMAKRAGILAVLEKPLQDSALLDNIRAALSGARNDMSREA